MNPLNYATPEASKRFADALKKAGKPMVTEASWYVGGFHVIPSLVPTKDAVMWGGKRTPAPSKAEVLRLLPDDSKVVEIVEDFLNATVESWEFTDLFIETVKLLRYVDRLIDLYIWVVERKV